MANFFSAVPFTVSLQRKRPIDARNVGLLYFLIGEGVRP